MSRLRLQSGFILAEVVVGMMIITMSLIAITGIFIQSNRAASVAAEFSVATNLAQKQLELLKLRPHTYWENLALPASIGWQGTVGETEPYSVITNAFVSSDNNNLVEVVVVVSWKQQGQTRQVQLTTCYSRIP